MGTDLYLYAEVQHDAGWQFLGTLEPNDEPRTDAEVIEPAWRPVNQYDGRDYTLFHVLGLERVPPHEAGTDPLPMIAPLRGLPHDLSPTLSAWLRYWDAIRGSWLLLAEVLAFPWQQGRQKEAMVSPRVAPLFRDPAAPFPFAHWPADEPISYAAYRRGGVTVQWTETYAQTAGSLLTELAHPLSQQYEPHHIRFVFWFD